MRAGRPARFALACSQSQWTRFPSANLGAGVPKILFLRNLKKLFLYSNVILVSRWYNYENKWKIVMFCGQSGGRCDEKIYWDYYRVCTCWNFDVGANALHSKNSILNICVRHIFRCRYDFAYNRSSGNKKIWSKNLWEYIYPALHKLSFRTSDNLDVPEFYCGKSTGNHRCCPYSYFYFGFANAS